MTASRRQLIEFTGVACTYPGPPPVTALRPCDLTIAAGEYVTVVGPSGSGKSTFLNIAGLLDRPTQGGYRFEGVDTGSLSHASRTALRGRRIGFVFQAFHLMPYRSVVENVVLPLVYAGAARAGRRQRGLEILEQVGLAHRAEATARHLSGGERQRVAIARALVSRPGLLLCDEPTGNLDTANTRAILALLDDLHAAHLTICVVTHDAGVAARGDRTIAIHDGIVTVDGQRAQA